MDLELVPVRPEDDTPERRFALLAAAFARDVPGVHPWTTELAVGGIRHPNPGYEQSAWLARVAGEDAGDVVIRLPQLDNTGNALVDLDVAHAYRRRGLGALLMEHALAVAREAGRVRVVAGVAEPIDGPVAPGRAFLEQQGFKPALTELLSLLDLTTLDEAAIAGMADEAAERAGAYEVQTWDGPPADDETCAQLGHLEGTLSEDAPLGELTWEREAWDADRVRRGHENLRAMGLRSMHAVARAGDGRIVAWTHLVSCPSAPTWAMQWETVVDPAHRGHRLGAAVKAANLAVLRERFPRVLRIETENAEDNAHMLRVNRAMGFVTKARVVEYQRDL